MAAEYSPERIIMRKDKKLVRQVLLFASTLAIIMALGLSAVGILNIRKAYYDSFADELHTSAQFIQSQLDNQWNGDWKILSNGTLTKGSFALHDDFQVQLDALKEQTGISFTVFYGDTRAITSLVDSTGKRMEGTKASDTVIEKVLTNGEEYLATNFTIDGSSSKWYAYYLPLKNADGSVVGMLFAGKETDDVLLFQSCSKLLRLRGCV